MKFLIRTTSLPQGQIYENVMIDYTTRYPELGEEISKFATKDQIKSKLSRYAVSLRPPPLTIDNLNDY